MFEVQQIVRSMCRPCPSRIGSIVITGDPARTRTWNPLLRRQMLYPVELRGHSIDEQALLAACDEACPENWAGLRTTPNPMDDRAL